MTAKAVDAVVERDHKQNGKPGNVDVRYLLAAVQEGVVELEQAADTLLAVYGAIGKESGIYTDTQLSRKMRLETRRLPELDEASLPEDTINYISQLQTEELAELADLTPMQDICYQLHCDSLSGREIAGLLGLSVQAVSHHLREARIRVKRACREGRYSGWYQIYLSEVNRTGGKPK